MTCGSSQGHMEVCNTWLKAGRNRQEVDGKWIEPQITHAWTWTYSVRQNFGVRGWSSAGRPCRNWRAKNLGLKKFDGKSRVWCKKYVRSKVTQDVKMGGKTSCQMWSNQNLKGSPSCIVVDIVCVLANQEKVPQSQNCWLWSESEE